MAQIPITANPMVYEVLDFTARHFQDDCEGNIYFARAALLNVMMRQFIFSQLLGAFGDEEIVDTIFQSTESAYAYYIKYLKAVRGEDGYRLCYTTEGKVAAVYGPNGVVIPGEKVIVEPAAEVEQIENEQIFEGRVYTEVVFAA